MDKDKVKLWQNRVEMARAWQEQQGNQGKRWDKNVRAMAADFDTKEMVGGNEAVDVNMVRSTMDTPLPPFWVTNPQVLVTPTRATVKLKGSKAPHDNVVAAELTQVELNYWFRELKFKNILKKCVIDSEAMNLGYCYIGYHRKKNPNLEQDGERIEPLMHIRPGAPYFKRLSPRDVLLPPGIYDLEDAQWVAIETRQPVEDARKIFNAPKLKPSRRLYEIREDEQKLFLERASKQFAAFIEKDEDLGVTAIYEIWDKRKKKVSYIAEDHEDELNSENWPHDLEGFPLATMRPTEIPDEYHGVPPMSYYLPQQIELNKARTRTAIRENRSKATVFISAEIAEEVKEAYETSKDGGLITVPIEPGQDIRKYIYIDQGLPPNTGAYAYGNQQMQDILFQTGMGSQQRGSGDPNAPTATSSANIEKWVAVRQTNRGDVISDFILSVATKTWMILRSYPNEERDRRVQGPRAGIYKNLRYTLKELHGEFAFEIDISAMINDNPMLRVQRTGANYQMFRQDPLANHEKLLLDVLQAQNNPDPESYLVTLKDPQEEFQRALMGIPSEADQRDDHEAHVKAHHVGLAKLEQALDQGFEPESDEGKKIRMALALLMAHINDHMRIVQEMSGGTAGQPQDANALRSDAAAEGQGETQAELDGNPVGENEVQTPGGLEIN